MIKLNDFKRVCFIFPALFYFPLLCLGYLIIDIFHTEIPEEVQSDLQTTEYLNVELPSANVKDSQDVTTFGNIHDLSAMENIENDLDSVKKHNGVNNNVQIHKSEHPVRTEVFEKLNRWFNNGVSFFSDIFTKGAVRVYVIEQGEDKSTKK